MLRATSNMLLVRADLHLTSLSLTIVKFFLHALPFDDEQSRSRKPCFKQHVARNKRATYCAGVNAALESLQGRFTTSNANTWVANNLHIVGQ